MKVFLSYSSQNREIVQIIYEAIISWGYEPWMDVHCISPGIDRRKTSWLDAVNQALQDCGVIIGCITEDALESKHVREELVWGKSNERRMIFLKLTPYDDKQMQYPFAEVNYIDFVDHIEAGLAKLKAALDEYADSQKSHGSTGPSWVDGIKYPNQDTQMELEGLSHVLREVKPNSEVTLIGGFYIDILIHLIEEVDTEKNKRAELRVDDLNFSIGGSAVFVAKYLTEKFQKNCTLISTQGSDQAGGPFDALLKAAQNMLGEMSRLHTELIPVNEQPAITTHISDDWGLGLMLTREGALSQLNWDRIAERGDKVFPEGSICYISSFMKTGLEQHLTLNLNRLRQKGILVLIDHGRPKHYATRNQVASLKTAFEQRLIQIYICTFRELWSFVHLYDEHGAHLPPLENTRHVERALENLSKEVVLPLATIVRDTDLPGDAKAFILIGGQAFPVISNHKNGERRKATGKWVDVYGKNVGHKNAFTASILNSLAMASDHSLDTWQSTFDFLWQCCQQALDDWYDVQKI